MTPSYNLLTSTAQFFLFVGGLGSLAILEASSCWLVQAEPRLPCGIPLLRKSEDCTLRKRQFGDPNQLRKATFFLRRTSPRKKNNPVIIQITCKPVSFPILG